MVSKLGKSTTKKIRKGLGLGHVGIAKKKQKTLKGFSSAWEVWGTTGKRQKAVPVTG